MILHKVVCSLGSMIKNILKDEFPFVNPGEWLQLIKDPETPKD